MTICFIDDHFCLISKRSLPPPVAAIMAGHIGMHSFASPSGVWKSIYTQGHCWLNGGGKRKGENQGERERQRKRQEERTEIPADVSLGLLRQKEPANVAEFPLRVKSQAAQGTLATSCHILEEEALSPTFTGGEPEAQGSHLALGVSIPVSTCVEKVWARGSSLLLTLCS